MKFRKGSRTPEIKRLVLEGMRPADIARRLGIHRVTVHQTCKRLGLPINQPRRGSYYTIQCALALGFTGSEIASAFSTAPRRIAHLGPLQTPIPPKYR